MGVERGGGQVGITEGHQTAVCDPWGRVIGSLYYSYIHVLILNSLKFRVNFRVNLKLLKYELHLE